MDSDDLKAEISKYDPPESEKRKDAFISLYYVVILLLIGVPMWYLTTTTYRASLPVSEINKLLNSKISLVIKVNVINFDGRIEMDDLFSLQDKLLQDFQETADGEFVKFEFTGYVRQATNEEMKTYQYAKILSDLDNKIISKLPANDIYVLILPNRSNLLTGYRTGVIRSRTDRNVLVLPSDSLERIKKVIFKCVTEILARNDDLNNVYRAALEVPGKESLTDIPKRIRSFLTRVRTSAKYDWTFSLIVPHPKGGDSIEWDFPRMEHLYLEPLIRQLAPFIRVKVSSQIIYGVRLERIWPSKHHRGDHHRGGGGERIYSREDLTHVVNGIESYLGSNTGLHFVGYIATGTGGENIATHLHTEGGARGNTDAFTVPRWGGVTLMNNVSSLPVSGDALMAVFLPQICALMGLSKPPPTVQIDDSNPPSAVSSPIFERGRSDPVATVAGWQIDAWLRERTVENLAITRVTLNSVLVLLDKVVNMVIRDDVAGHIRAATQLSLNSLAALRSRSDNSLQIAFLSSKQALEAAETAFFHPSLLELLYFQEDQKIGIYIPLFVPVLLPVFLAALKAKPYLLAMFKSKTD